MQYNTALHTTQYPIYNKCTVLYSMLSIDLDYLHAFIIYIILYHILCNYTCSISYIVTPCCYMITYPVLYTVTLHIWYYIHRILHWGTWLSV